MPPGNAAFVSGTFLMSFLSYLMLIYRNTMDVCIFIDLSPATLLNSLTNLTFFVGVLIFYIKYHFSVNKHNFFLTASFISDHSKMVQQPAKPWWQLWLL